MTIQEPTSDFIALAREKFNHGDYQESIKLFRKSLVFKEDWMTYQGLGSALFKICNYTDSISIFRKSLVLKKHWNSYFGLGLGLLKTNQYQEAIDVLNKSLLLKKHWNTYQALAWAYFNSKKYMKAVSAFRKSLNMKEDWNSYRGLAWALFNINEFNEAIDIFRKSISIKESWHLYKGLGSALLKTHQYQEAIEILHKSLDLKKDWNSYQCLGWALFNDKQLVNAIKAFQKSINLKEDWNTYLGLGWTLFYKNEFNEAIPIFRKSIELNLHTYNGLNEDESSYRGLGKALLMVNKLTESLEAFRQSISVNENWRSYQELGFGLLRTKQFKTAIIAFRNSIALSGNKYSYEGLSQALNNIDNSEAFYRENENSHKAIDSLEAISQPLGDMTSTLEAPSNIFRISDYETLKIGDFNHSRDINSENYKDENDTYPLSYTRIRDAIITNIYGVHNNQGFSFKESIITRGMANSPKDFPLGVHKKLNLSIYQDFDEIKSAIWIKYLDFNFGHDLTEMCANIYPLLFWAEKGFDLNKLTIIIPAKSKHNKTKLAQLLCIKPQRIKYVGEGDLPQRVNLLYIPRPTMLLYTDFMHMKHSLAVKAYLKLYIKNVEKFDFSTYKTDYFLNHNRLLSKQAYPQKVYISRSRLSSEKRKFIQETEIEKDLVDHGWTILFPERTSLANQLEIYEHANVIAGIEGSAFHLLMGVDNQNVKVLLLSESDDSNHFKCPKHSQVLRVQFFLMKTNISVIKCLKYAGDQVSLSGDYTSKNISKIINRLSS